MASIDFAEVERFAQLFPTGECPKFPQAVADLPENLTQREMIRSAMPELWQLLTDTAEDAAIRTPLTLLLDQMEDSPAFRRGQVAGATPAPAPK